MASSTASPRRSSSKRASWLAAAGAAILGLLLLATWHGGQESAQLDEQHLRAELNQERQTVSSLQMQLEQLRSRAQTIEKTVQPTTAAAAETQGALRQQLLKAQAEASQYKAILDRERQASIDNARVLSALSSAGARLLPMKGTGAAADSIAYVVVVENSRILFVGTDLPKLNAGREFQLWLVRKEDPKFVSAGLFSTDNKNTIVLQFDNPSVTSGITSIALTDEPDGGSETPIGNKLMETNGAAPGQ